jgi:hypothetical protein
VVFPDAMNPIRKIGASSSVGGIGRESYSKSPGEPESVDFLPPARFGFLLEP